MSLIPLAKTTIVTSFILFLGGCASLNSKQASSSSYCDELRRNESALLQAEDCEEGSVWETRDPSGYAQANEPPAQREREGVLEQFIGGAIDSTLGLDEVRAKNEPCRWGDEATCPDTLSKPVLYED